MFSFHNATKNIVLPPNFYEKVERALFLYIQNSEKEITCK